MADAALVEPAQTAPAYVLDFDTHGAVVLRCTLLATGATVHAVVAHFDLISDADAAAAAINQAFKKARKRPA